MNAQIVPITARVRDKTHITISYFFQPNIFAPAHIGTIIVNPTAKTLPIKLRILSNDGMSKAPITARTARITRMIGRKMDFIRSRRLWPTSSAVETGSILGDKGGFDEGEFDRDT